MTERFSRQQGSASDYIARNTRALRRHAVAAVAGFDQNEDPVIIGSGATAGGGSTPDNVSGGAPGAVSIGEGAEASGDYATAVGSAIATGTLSSAFGGGATATHDRSSAIGYSSTTHTDFEVCIGDAGAFASVPGDAGGLVLRKSSDALGIVINHVDSSVLAAIPTPGQAIRTNLWDAGTGAPSSPVVGVAGITVSSPDGTQWLLGVDNTGAPIATAV